MYSVLNCPILNKLQWNHWTPVGAGDIVCNPVFDIRAAKKISFRINRIVQMIISCRTHQEIWVRDFADYVILIVLVRHPHEWRLILTMYNETQGHNTPVSFTQSSYPYHCSYLVKEEDHRFTNVQTVNRSNAFTEVEFKGCNWESLLATLHEQCPGNFWIPFGLYWKKYNVKWTHSIFPEKYRQIDCSLMAMNALRHVKYRFLPAHASWANSQIIHKSILYIIPTSAVWTDDRSIPRVLWIRNWIQRLSRCGWYLVSKNSAWRTCVYQKYIFALSTGLNSWFHCSTAQYLSMDDHIRTHHWYIFHSANTQGRWCTTHDYRLCQQWLGTESPRKVAQQPSWWSLLWVSLK